MVNVRERAIEDAIIFDDDDVMLLLLMLLLVVVLVVAFVTDGFVVVVVVSLAIFFHALINALTFGCKDTFVLNFFTVALINVSLRIVYVIFICCGCNCSNISLQRSTSIAASFNDAFAISFSKTSL